MFVVGGENLIDFIQEIDDDGLSRYRAVPGGSPYNVAKALALQAVETGYLTPISSDSLGDLLVADLPQENLVLLAKRSDKPTSLAVVSLVNGQPAYQFYRENTAERDVTPQSLNETIPARARGFYIGSLALANGDDSVAWEDAWVACHKRGIFTAIDPNIRAAFIHDRNAYLTRLEAMFKQADLIKLSDEDIGWITPDTPVLDAAQAMFARSNAALLVLTLGKNGAVAISANGQISVPAFPVPDLKDTVGAGDTFMATLLAQIDSHGLLEKTALQRASPVLLKKILYIATKAAAINCGRIGCNPPLLTEL